MSDKYLNYNGLAYLWSKISPLLGGGAGSVGNYSLMAQTLPADTRTLIIGTNVSFPVGALRSGTIIKWTFDMSKTAAGKDSSTIDIAFGTTGTTADTARVSFTKPAGTAVADNGLFTIELLVRSTGLSGQVVGHLNMTHNLSTTGLAKIPAVNATVVSAVFDMSALTNISVCFKSGTSDAYTVQLVKSELFNVT